MGEGDEPTGSEIQEIRDSVEDELAQLAAGHGYDERDRAEIRTNDHLVGRYFKHALDMGGDQVEMAVKMIVNSLKWRKETGIRDLTANDLSPVLKAKGSMYSRNFDQDGKKLLVFDVKKHVKGKENVADMKTFFLYHVERIDREQNGDMLTLVFDCAGCGLKNMDLDFIQYMISVFKDYTPWNLNYILVLEMPMVLNMAWKIIKGWLPPSAVKKIKFLNKSSLKEFVPEDQRFSSWGGNDPWEYEFIPEQIVKPVVNSPTESSSGNLDPIDEAQRKVKFDVKKSPDSSQDLTGNSPGRSHSFNYHLEKENNNIGMLTIMPPDEIVFNANDQGDRLAKVQITNSATTPIVFKIKTTCPDKYRVRPSMGSLGPGAKASVEIHIQAALVTTPALLLRDKFLITAFSADTDGLMNQQITEITKSKKPEAQYRLRCTVPGAKTAVTAALNGFPPILVSGIPESAAKPVPSDVGRKIDTLTRKMAALFTANQELKEQLDLMKKATMAILVLVVLLLFTLLWRTHGIDLACSGSGHEAALSGMGSSKEL